MRTETEIRAKIEEQDQFLARFSGKINAGTCAQIMHAQQVLKWVLNDK